MADGSDEEVGYGRPPKEHQFKKGQSGNPKGRPRRSDKPHDIVARLRDERIPLTIDGRRKNVSLLEASLRRTIQQCLQHGRVRDLEKLLELLEKHGGKQADDLQKMFEEGADSAIKQLFRVMDRTIPQDQGSPEWLQLDAEEHAIVAHCPQCSSKLTARWEHENVHAPQRMSDLRRGVGFQLGGRWDPANWSPRPRPS